MKDNLLANREIIIEFIPVGQFVRVSAMDTVTLTEVVLQGPLNATRETLERNAIKKLEYVMKKKGLI